MSDEMTKLHGVTASQIPNGAAAAAAAAELQLQDIKDNAANVDNSVWGIHMIFHMLRGPRDQDPCGDDFYTSMSRATNRH